MRPDPWRALVLEPAAEAAAERRLRAVVHDLRQPLAAVFALAEAAVSVPGIPDEARAHLMKLIEQTQEVSAVAASALAADELDDPGEDSADMIAVLDSVIDAFTVTWPGRLLRRGRYGPLVVAGDRVTLRRCLVNVVENATRAAGHDGTVIVTVRHVGSRAVVVVRDDGPGFGRVPRRSGLGLETTCRAIEELGGTLSVARPCSSTGSRVRISLPVSSPHLAVSGPNPHLA